MPVDPYYLRMRVVVDGVKMMKAIPLPGHFNEPGDILKLFHDVEKLIYKNPKSNKKV